MIYTSYYGNARKIPSNLIKVGISASSIQGVCEYFMPSLTPSWDLVRLAKDQGDYSEYVRKFKEQLNKLDPHAVAKALEGTVMLCYEAYDNIVGTEQPIGLEWQRFGRPGKFCHRHIIAEWLRTAGHEVEELKC